MITGLRTYDRRVSDYQPSSIRISDTEREDALAKLGEHMSTGRLDIDEYGDRSAKVATAKTRGDLLGLFGDLPEPKPAFGQPRTGAVQPRERTFMEKVGPFAFPLAAILVIGAVMVVLKVGFFVPVLLCFLFFRGTWGGGRGHGPHRRMRHERGH